MAFTDNGKSILAKYGLYQPSEEEKKHQQDQAALRVRDAGTMATNAAIELARGLGARKAGVQIPSFQAFNPTTGKAAQTDETGTALQEGPQAGVNPYAYQTPANMRGSQWTDDGRRILAKYGLADYTREEMAQRQTWANKLSGYSDEAQNAYTHLGDKGWLGYTADKANRDALDRQIAEIEAEMKRVGYYDVNYNDMGEYANYLRKLRSAYDARERGAGYAGSLEEYNAAQKLQDIQGHLGNTSWSDLGADRQYTRDLDLTLQAAQRELQQATGKRRDELQEYVDWLQQMKSAYDSRAEVRATFQDQKTYEDFMSANDLFENADGRTYDEIYRGTVRDLENAREKAEQAKKTRERIEDMRKELIEYQYYPSRGLTLNGMKNPTREEVQQRLQSLEQDAKLAEAEENMLLDQMARADRISKFAGMRRYDDLPTRPDFEAQVGKGREAYEQKYGPLDLGTENELETAIKEASKRIGNANMTFVGLPATAVEVYKDTSYREPTKDWTKENLETFFYLYANNEENPEDAWAYASSLNDAIRAKKLAEQTRSAEDWTNRSGWHRAAAWGAGVASAPFQLEDFAQSGMEYAFHGRISPHENATIADYANAMTGAASRFLNEEYGTLPEYLPVVGGKGWGDAYQLTQSIAQSALTAAAGGGVTNLLFFGSAANQAVEEAKARGATDGQALVFGALCGAAEVLGETISIEHLISIRNPATLRQFLWNVLKQGGVEASEEAFTTVLTTLSDAIVMGDKSELNQMIRQYQESGMSRAEAERKAWAQWANNIAYDALGGFISGGISSAGKMGIGMAVSSQTAYSGEDTRQLLELGLRQNKDSKAYQLAERAQKSGTMSELEAQRLKDLLGDDAEALQRNIRKGVVEDARKRLLEAGIGERSATRMAETVARDVLGEELDWIGRADHSQDFQNPVVRKIASDMKEERAYAAAARRIVARANREAAKKNTTEQRKALEKKVKTLELKTGDKVEIKSVGMEGNEIVYTYEKDGKEIRARESDARMGDDQRIALRTFARILGNDAAAAFNKMTWQNLSGDAYSVRQYAVAFANIRDLYGAKSTNDAKSEQAALASPLRGNLTDAQVLLAYSIGKQRAAAGGEKTERPKSRRGTGRVSLSGGVVDGMTLKGVKDRYKVERSKEFRALRAVARALHIDVVLFESEATNKKGDLEGIQGAYQDGVIYLDWNAGMNNLSAVGDRMLMRTMAHELTHFIQQNAKEDYAELRDFVEEYLSKKMGESFNDLVLKKMQGRNVDKDGAMDEVVADACETMLRDSAVVDELMREHNGLWGKIRKFVRDFLSSITADDEGAQFMQDAIDELRAIWDKGLRTAVESRTDAETSAAEMKAEVLENSSEALTDIDPTQEEATVTLPDGAQHSIRSMKHDIAEGKMFEDLERYTDMSHDEVRELRTNLERLTDIIALNRDILDMNETVGKDNRTFKPFKPNSDPLYTISLDFSTLCRKRLMTQYVIEKLQTELTDSQTGKRGRPLTAEEQLAVRDLMKEYAQQEKALKVACAMCYVEAARLKAPSQIQRFMRDPTEPMRRYFALRNSEFNAKVLEAQADFKEQHGYPRNATKSQMKPSDVTALNKLSARLRDGYQMSAEEQAEVDIAKSLPNETYLTAANLAKLADEQEGHPTIYDAYTYTIRSATRSKSLEADIPYYYGDSAKAVKDKFIEAVNRENGMRFSSWSDFQIQHMLDMMTAVIELSVRHCAMHGYTKFLEQVRIFGKTGMMFNMSGVPSATGLKADGSLDFSTTDSVLVHGQDGEYDAVQAREDFPETAGLQCIGMSRAHILALLASDIMDYIIPYHTSGMNATLRRMAQIYSWDDFTTFQNAKNDDRIKFDPRIHDRKTWHKEPVFSEFFNAAKQESNGYRAGEKGVVTMRRAADLYKQMCRERGMMPKFSWGNSKVDADFSNDPNYWKLLIDRKMINQKTGALIEQKPVRPDFDFKLIEQMVQEAVDAYDPTLQGRALNYVRDHLDELPQRIADLKKAGAVKKVTNRKTNKAAKTLQAGPVAAMSEGNAKAQLSARSTQTAEEVEAEAEEMSDTRTQYSVRQGPPPKKTMIGYKVFMADKKHPGQLYPTKVKNPGGQGTPVGVWLDADTGEIARNPDGSIKTNTRGRISVKANGGTLAWRPGWHLGSLPEANQMNRVDPKNPESDNSNRGTTGLMWDNYIFCECEFAADEDYQLEAFEFGTDEKGRYNHSQAGLPYIPKDGYYKYRTNPDPSTAPWFISGSIRITKILDDDMRREIIEQWNAEHPDQQMRFTERYSGKPINLADYGLKAGPVAQTEDLSSVAPGVDYSDEIRNLPGYTRHALNFDDPNVQEAFRIQQIEDRKDYYIDKYNREHRDDLENGSKKAATTGGKVQMSVRNREYMDAVKRGDMDAAQKMVDEAAKAAGYTIKAYHGTSSKEFNVFDRNFSKYGLFGDGFYFTEDKKVAESYQNTGKGKTPGVYAVYLNSKNELDMDAEADTEKWINACESVIDAEADIVRDDIELALEYEDTDNLSNADMFEIITKELGSRGYYEEQEDQWGGKYIGPGRRTGALFEQIVKEMGYTGLTHIGGIRAGKGKHLHNVHIVFDSDQIKSADPVTYDDDGEVIPLSQRFNKATGDIRYSVRSDNKTDRELLANAYQDMLRNEQLHAKAQTELVATKQRVINRMQQEQKEALEAHHKQLEDFKKKEKEVFTELAKLDRLVQEGTDPDAIREQRAKATAAEERMNTAMKKLAQMQERPALQKILQDERQIQRERTRRQLRENINKRELRKKVDRLWKDLNRRITSPTEKKNIPVEVMQQAVEVLQALNMDTSREGSKAGEKLRSKLDALNARYRELQNDPDYRKAAMYDAQVAEFLQKMTEAVGDTPINKMSYEQLETVFNTLQALDFTARRALKLKLGEEERNAYEVSMDMTRETRSVAKPKTGLVSAWLNAQLSAERMFRRLGNYHKNSVWEQVYRMLDDGQLKQTRLMMEGSLIFEDLLAAKDYEKFVDPKNTVDLGLQDANGNAVRLTHGMMVSLWMHLQNEQNRRHVAYGGLTIPGLADYYKGNKTKGSERAVRVGGVLQEMAEINDRLRETEDADEIAELEAQRDALAIKAFDFLQSLESAIEKNLSAYDRQWIEACKEMFDGFSKRVLNETTMEVYGIKRANVENYFPIWVDGDFLNTPFETVAKDMSLENAGFMKERVDSSKPIRLADVSDVAASQIRKVSQYAGLMPVVRDFNKIWGKTQTGYRDSLRKAVHETFGQNGVKYIENLMADLNGARGQDKGSLGEFFDRMRGHMAQAALTLSLRTAMGQAASYPTAASVVGWKALHKAFWKGGKSGRMISRADQELIRKWSPLLYYRMKGYRDTELGNIAGMNSKFDRIWKKARWATGWIQAMDGATVGRLWYAAEYYVQDHRKDLAQGSDAYYEEVAKVFNDIVEKTQPNYSVMQRPDILRNPNALVKQLTMFLTQRLQNFNILYDACATYSTMKADYKAGRNGVTREDVRQAAVETRTAVLSQVAAAATIVAFKFVADMILHSMNAYRDDDDKELTAESVSMELLDMFLDSLAGNVLGGSEVYDLIESKVFNKSYYGISLSGVETVTDLIDAVSKVYDHAANGKYKDKDAILSDLDLLAKRLGPVAGIPYANAKKIILGGWYWIQDIKNGEFLHFEAGVDRTSAQQAARAVSAYEQADSLKIDKILAEVGVDKEKTLRENMRKQIKQQYQNGEISFYEAEKRLKEYGEASDQMMRNFINAEYEAGHITRTEAAAELARYGGMTAEAAEKSMIKAAAKQDTGLSYNEIDDMFQLGNLTAAEARDALVKYGLSREDASLKVEYWDYQNKHPGSYYTSEERYRAYVNNYKPLGFTAEMYESFKTRWDEVPGEDKNHDGKADPNTKKYQRIEIIDSLPLSSAQKDALFNMEWKTGLEKAPWHK